MRHHFVAFKTMVYKALAEQEMARLESLCQFKSVKIVGNAPWSDVYHWATTTHTAIAQCCRAMSLPMSAAGLNQQLHLCYNPLVLGQGNMAGCLVPGSHESTIHLGSASVAMQKKVWQHEYTHALDQRLGVNYLVSRGEFNPLAPGVFMSQMASRAMLEGRLLSQQPGTLGSVFKSMEASMAIFMGQSDPAHLHAAQQCSRRTMTLEISRYLVVSSLFDPQADWEHVSETQRQRLLNSPAVAHHAWLLSDVLSLHGPQAMHTLLHTPQYHEALKSFCREISREFNFPEELFFTHVKAVNLKNCTALAHDLQKFSRRHGYVNEGDMQYFALSGHAHTAVLHAIAQGNSYWAQPKEILARASEKIHHDTLSNSQDWSPCLNVREKSSLIQCLSSMARCLGLEAVAPCIPVNALLPQYRF